jgi:hypothetical protein
VIADGGVVPAGVSGTNAFFNAVKTIYGTSDITTAVSVGVDAHYLGYKLGAGAGATLGQAVQKLYSCAGSSGDVVQTTAASQPLLLAHNGASSDNYWWGSGVEGNYLSTPNAAANQITGDIDIRAQTNRSTNPAVSNLVSKWDATGGYYLGFNNGSLVFVCNPGIFAQSSTTDPTADGTIHWVRATRTATTGDVNFYTSTDGITYTQLGTTQTSTAGNMNASNDVVRIGARDNLGANGAFQGKIYRATIANSIGGTPVVDFNPATYNASTSQTQWTSTTGEVWTINTGTASTGYKGVLVDRTIVQGDGVDDTILSGTLTSKQYFSQHAVINPFNIPSGGGSYYVDGGGANGLIYGNVDGFIAFNGADLNFIGDLEYKLQYLQADFNNVSSNIYLNNANNVSGSTGTRITTKCCLMSNNSSGPFGNCIISTVISGLTIDTPTQRTEMYNYIRSINNNAF